MSKQDQVLEQLKVIIDPDLGKDIVSLGFIKNLEINGGTVSFVVELTTPACPVKDRFKAAAEAEVGKLDWVERVDVTMSAQQPRGAGRQPQAAGLREVANIIAVSSCKGGVGKSTVAVNLAYSLAASGARVGIFDADVYGPSLPTLVTPDESDLYAVGDMIQPLEHEGVRLMSFGFVNTRDGGGGPAIMRGPMVSQVINQLLTTTAWGELDYLVIDFPPGTGDIQLTLLQLIPITAAVIVTTPQELSFVDVVKGIQMFDKLKVPTIGVVENMSYFICDQCDKKHEIFGNGAKRRLVEQFGIRSSFEVPLDPRVSQLSDSGVPIVRADPDAGPSRIYNEIAGSVAREVSKLNLGALAPPAVSYSPKKGIIVRIGDDTEHRIHPAALRRRCRCALCIEEMTGEQILKPEDIADDVHPKSIHPMGNYAVAMHWSDGHTTSIYPYDALLAAAEAQAATA